MNKVLGGRLGGFSATLLFAVVCVVMFTTTASAQDKFPSKPVKFIISQTAGSGGDAFARSVAENLARRVNQSVVVDPRPGAGGNLAAEIVAKAAPDGYSLLHGSLSSLAIAVSYYKSLNYDVQREFVPITRTGSGDWHELTLHIIIETLVVTNGDGQRRERAVQQAVTVRRRLGNDLGGKIAPCARTRIDHHRLIDTPREIFGDASGKGVATATSGLGNDEFDRFRWKFILR